MKKFILCLIAYPLWVNAQTVQEQFASAIQADSLMHKLQILAGVEMQGRETATPGQRKAASFIENYFSHIGLLPAEGMGFQQPFPVMVHEIKKTSVVIHKKSYHPITDYNFNVTRMPTGQWKISNIFYAGYGDDSSAISQDVVKDKWVMIAEGSKKRGFTSTDNRLMMAKVGMLKRRLAAGVLMIQPNFPHTHQGLRSGMSNLSSNQSPTQEIPILYISKEMCMKLLKLDSLAGDDFSSIRNALYKTKLHVRVDKQSVVENSTNVIGILPGTDKKDEYVFITAHYDHLGMRDSVIYYGADDDGSGTVAVMELAKVFSLAAQAGYRCRRTLVFMAVSGEEKGLWGSAYYSDHPVFSMSKTSVDLNIDMIGRIDPKRTYGDSTNYIYTIGDDKLCSQLSPITDSINHRYTHLEIDRKYNRPDDPNRFYYRSDHYNFAKNGVPVIFYFNGTHADYHRPSDTVDKIRFDIMQKRVSLIYYTAWHIANMDNMLLRDRPLSEVGQR